MKFELVNSIFVVHKTDNAEPIKISMSDVLGIELAKEFIDFYKASKAKAKSMLEALGFDGYVINYDTRKHEDVVDHGVFAKFVAQKGLDIEQLIKNFLCQNTNEVTETCMSLWGGECTIPIINRCLLMTDFSCFNELIPLGDCQGMGCIKYLFSLTQEEYYSSFKDQLLYWYNNFIVKRINIERFGNKHRCHVDRYYRPQMMPDSVYFKFISVMEEMLDIHKVTSNGSDYSYNGATVLSNEVVSIVFEAIDKLIKKG